MLLKRYLHDKFKLVMDMLDDHVYPMLAGMSGDVDSKVWYVNKWTGNDSYNGLSWKHAFATIQAAITANNATIDWSAYPKKINTILVAPGVYAEALTPPYDCRIIGTGIPGTDQCTEIHPAAGSALTGTGLGLHLKNLHFEADEVLPVIDFGIVGSTIIENCEIMNGAGYQATHGISTEDAKHLIVRKCTFGSGSTKLTHGIYAAGGADKFFHHCTVEDCQIHAGIGIHIQDTCTGTHSVIQRNMINCTTLGIDDDSDDVAVIDNRIISAAILASAYDINLAKAAGNIVTGSDDTLEVPICAA